MEAWMGPSGFLVIIESQAIMVSTRVAIGKLIHALEVWSDGPRLPNIEPLQPNPLQPTLQQYSAVWAIQRPIPVHTGCGAVLQYSAIHSTALQRSTLYSALQSPSGYM